MLTFRRLGFGKDLTTEQNAFLTQLVQMDEPYDGFFQFIAKGIVKALGNDEAANFNAVILQKHFELLQTLPGVFHPTSFTYQLAFTLLEEVSFSVEKHSQEVFKILENLAPEQKLDETLRARKLSAGEKLADLYKSKSPAELKLEQKLRHFFSNVPDCVIALFLPLFHSVTEKLSQQKGKIHFSEEVFERFFKAPMLNSPLEKDLPNERKISLLANAQTINPFFTLVERLDLANKQYAQAKINPQSVAVVQAFVEAYMLLFQFKNKIKQLSAIFAKIQHGFKREEEKNSWSEVYKRVLNSLAELDKKLTTHSNNKTPEQIKLLVKESNDILNSLLLIIIKDPLPDLNDLLALDKELTLIKTRIDEIIEVLDIVEKMFEKNSPAMRSNREAVANLRALFEEYAVSLVNNVVSAKKDEKEEAIIQFETSITKVVVPLMQEVIDGQTILHRVLTCANPDKQAQQRQFECLLREGAELETTTTKYEKKSWVKWLPGKNEPLNALELAKLYKNDDVLSLADQNVSAQRERKNSQNSEKLQAFISDSLENSKKLSSSGIPLKIEKVPLVSEPVVIPAIVSPSSTWKRARTPGNTPRSSEEAHTDKKSKSNTP